MILDSSPRFEFEEKFDRRVKQWVEVRATPRPTRHKPQRTRRTHISAQQKSVQLPCYSRRGRSSCLGWRGVWVHAPTRLSPPRREPGVPHTQRTHPLLTRRAGFAADSLVLSAVVQRRRLSEFRAETLLALETASKTDETSCFLTYSPSRFFNSLVLDTVALYQLSIRLACSRQGVVCSRCTDGVAGGRAGGDTTAKLPGHAA
jgi:hypothetical protein